MTPNRRKAFVADRSVLLGYKLIWALATVNLILFGFFAYTAFPALMTGDSGQIGLGSLYMLGIVTTLLSFGSIGLAIYCVVHWHRLLGAAYRIQTSIREVHTTYREEGRVSGSVRLRQGDQLLPLADEVNELVTTLASSSD